MALPAPGVRVLAAVKAGVVVATDAPSADGGTPRLTLTPDARRGDLRVARVTGGDVRLQWRDRGTGAVPPEYDLAVVPGDVKLRRVASPAAADRVYEASEGAGQRRLFFWLQAADASGDDDAVAKLQTALDGGVPSGAGRGAPRGGGLTLAQLEGLLAGVAAPARTPAAAAPAPAPAPDAVTVAAPTAAAPVPAQAATAVEAAPAAADSAAADDADMDDELRAALALSVGDGARAPAPAAVPPTADDGLDEEMSEELRAALALSVGDGAPSAAPAAAAAASQPGQQLGFDFAKAFESLASAGLLGAGAGSGGKTAARRRRGGGGGGISSSVTPLPHVLDADALSALVRENEGAREALLPLLPPGQRTLTHLLATLRSPQLRQAAMSLTGALDDGVNGGAVFASFGLRASDGADALARGDAVGALVAAIQADVNRAGSGGGAGASAPAPAAADGQPPPAPVPGSAPDAAAADGSTKPPPPPPA